MKSPATALAVSLLACATAKPAPEAPPRAERGLGISVETEKLDNGLRVVLSRESTVPTVTVGVYYGIGFRIEPRDRTGFAHLFEHMMFQGSQNLGKMQFIKLVQSNGGVLNGSTRFDFTNYFEIVPSNVLQTVLWAEADRMRGLAVTEENLKNQQGVVSSEVRVNVLNQPYGGFPWLDMPQAANTNWYNAHNFYGDLKDIQAATLQDVQQFFKTYYTPSNAVLVISGDFEPAQARAWVKQYFAPIPSGPRPALPDIAEPRQEQEKRVTQTDKLATRPGLALGYHLPARGTPEWYGFIMLEQILAEGHDSLLYQAVVQKRGLSAEVNAAINELGSPFNIKGPVLLDVWFFHDKEKSADEILAACDEEIEKLRTAPVDAAAFARAKVKMRSALYGILESTYGFGRADLLASYALFDEPPQKINDLEGEFAKVTPELMQKTAQEWLRKGNRTVIVLEAGGGKP
jgi:predicted Zn-dependent peptidase